MSKLIGQHVRIKKTGVEGVIVGYDKTKGYEVKIKNKREYVKRGQFEKIEPAPKKSAKPKTKKPATKSKTQKKPATKKNTTKKATVKQTKKMELPKVEIALPDNNLNLSATQTKKLVQYLKEETDKKDDFAIILQLSQQEIQVQRDVLLKILQKLVKATTAIGFRVERQKVATVRHNWRERSRVPEREYNKVQTAFDSEIESVHEEEVLVIDYVTESGAKGSINVLSDTMARAGAPVKVEKVVA